MKVLAIGGSGLVGTLVLPFLAARHDIAVFDLVPTRLPNTHFIKGDVRDEAALLDAFAGFDSLITMMSGPDPLDAANAAAHFDVNVTGLYVALSAAHKAGLSHAVVASTMSVYDALGRRVFDDESLAPDAHHFYGLSKRLGEEVCRMAQRQWGINITALRLCRVVDSAELGTFQHPFIATAASDVANAFDLALQRRLPGFEALNINGDWLEHRIKLTKAKTLLGWQPLARPQA